MQYVSREGSRPGRDLLAVEEPMEIRLGFGAEGSRQARSLSITMRTPGNDFELAAGFLFTEQIVTDPAHVGEVAFCGPPAPGRETSNIVRVELGPEVEVDLGRLQRHFYTTSSCGICGKASLDAVAAQGLRELDRERPRLSGEVIHRLPDLLRGSQPVFERTGGLHAAAVARPDGTLVHVREDVGRHNAVDKLLGRFFLDGQTDLGDSILVVSGRASFELVQKALAAGLPAMVAVGAPSSLAVDLAERYGMTLIGFASADRFNVYTGHGRMI
ncbi:formate dehydrogenase [Acidobacteria bacterium Mor1]|nr:formate dehydrogenase [Acidobacteria bacterium Mor1]